MPGFTRLQDADASLACDGVPLAAIAAAEGTPVYVYSASTLRDRYRALDDAFGGYPHAIHYALKANSTLAIARLLRGLGRGAVSSPVARPLPAPELVPSRPGEVKPG